MSSSSPTSIDFVDLFQDSLIAWASRDELVSLPASPHLDDPNSRARIVSAEQAVLKVKSGRRCAGNLVAWNAQGLHSKPNAFLACVVKGTADLSVGVTDAMVRSTNASAANGIYHLRLHEKDVLIQPAGVPTADGRNPHWCEREKPQPDSTILWIDILAEGAILHTCHTVNGCHLLGPCRFVFNTRLLLVIEAIFEEFQTQSGSPSTARVSEAIVNALLEVLFLRIYRSLYMEKAGTVEGEEAVQIMEQGIFPEPSRMPSASYAIRRSCHFIQGRLGHVLTVKKIADHSFVSPTQLNRMFRAELNQSVMEYVSEQRLDLAKSLLINTSLPIKVVSENVGINNAVYFSRLFREKMQMTPNQFRKNHR